MHDLLNGYFWSARSLCDHYNVKRHLVDRSCETKKERKGGGKEGGGEINYERVSLLFIHSFILLFRSFLDPSFAKAARPRALNRVLIKLVREPETQWMGGIVSATIWILGDVFIWQSKSPVCQGCHIPLNVQCKCRGAIRCSSMTRLLLCQSFWYDSIETKRDHVR